MAGKQPGCTEYENGQFWETIDSEVQTVKRSLRLVVAGYLNGHVGSERIYEDVFFIYFKKYTEGMEWEPQRERE